MDKNLLKIYFCICLALMIIILFFPAILPNTSKAVHEKFIVLSNFLNHSKREQYAAEPNSDKAKIIIIMDDGWLSQYSNGYKIMSKYNIKGNIAVIPTRVGQENYMNLKQLSELYLKGWDMLNHTYNHENLSILPYYKQEMQINRGRTWLVRRSLKCGSDILVFPGGAKSDITFEVLYRNNYKAGRGLEDIWITSPNMRLGEVVFINLTDYLSADEVIDAINLVIENKSYCIIILHKVENGHDAYHMKYPIGDFETIIKFIDSKKDSLEVLTLSEMLHYYK